MTWLVVLYFCASAPCTPRYWPEPYASPYACARAAIVLRQKWGADGGRWA